jgi:hypothetical protein
MTSELSTNGLSATLRQGLQFKKYQNKIIATTKNSNTYTQLEKNSNSAKEGFTNVLSQQSSDALQQTKQVLSASHISQNEISELENLQTTFNSLLELFKSAQSQLSSTTKTYIDVTNQPANLQGKLTNVRVNSVLNDANIASYLGEWNDKSDAPAMDVIPNNRLTFNDCKQAAMDTGKKYFGLENQGVGKEEEIATCSTSNDLTAAQKYGKYKPLCSLGNDQNMYASNDSTIAFYSNGQFGGYYGCFKDDTDPNKKAMIASGPNMASYTPVNVCGPMGMGPWGYFGAGSIDANGASWIWYTPNAQNDAPNNVGAPMTLIYNYFYNGSTYVNAIINGACDNSASVYLNGQLIGKIDGGWSDTTLQSFPITIAPGNNYISAAVENAGGPAGFILSVQNPQKNFLFSTNPDWKYTNISPTLLIPNRQNYSVDTCKKYSEDAGYSYFGLQNGGEGSSSCFVAENYDDATKYGTSTGANYLMADSTNHVSRAFGTSNVNAIYELDKVGNPADLNKIGYVDYDGKLSEYTSDMIGADMTIKNNTSCSKKIENIDSFQWENYPNSGSKMTPDTQCGLSRVIAPDNQSLDQIRSRLVDVAEKLVQKITYLETMNIDLNNQMGIDKNVLNQNLQQYKDVVTKYKKSFDMTNINGIMADSDIVVLKENYTYVFWSILAISVVIIAMNLLRNR